MHHQELRRFAAALTKTRVSIRIQPLRGGLESCGVTRVDVRSASTGKPLRSFVVKRVAAEGSREGRIHRTIAAGGLKDIAPAFLGADRVRGGGERLYFEWLPGQTWPWTAVPVNRRVLEQVARLHRDAGAVLAGAASDWDYGAELAASAASTVELYRGAHEGLPALTRVLERTAGSIGDYRRQLFAAYGQTVVHGDVHTGNAIVCKAGSRKGETVLIDWARARIGSPLEDVCSWLHSVGFWEPEARRRHDTLFAAYLRAARGTDRIGRNLREAYWLAGACNAFAGALRYHLAVLADAATPDRRRGQAERAARDWLRIIRRADAVWRA
jgi:Ser/Thr protein kinase RdoA (MazF antagonist)